MAYACGIDLGTTYCAAAVARGENVEIVQLGSRSATIPSVVLLRREGDLLVGEAAERRALSEPVRAAQGFKRRLGDPTPIMLGTTPYSAEGLLAELLKNVLAQVSQQEGEPPAQLVVTHPASYGPYKRELMEQLLREAGLPGAKLLTEPEAAAIHYSRQERFPTGHIVAVYDLGGGTFDAAVLRKTDDGFEMLGAPEGIERLGGIDFDHAVLAHVQQSIGEAFDILDQEDSAVGVGLARLREECQRAKELLSQDADVSIPVMLPGINTSVRLTREEFEGMIRPRVGQSIEALRRAVSSAGLGMEQIDRILMVGGSSRIPLLSQVVGEMTGRPVALDAHPKHAISLGAAAWAAQHSGAFTTPVDAPVMPVVATGASGASTPQPAVPVAPPPPQPVEPASQPVPVTEAALPSTPTGKAEPPPPPRPSAAGAGGRKLPPVALYAIAGLVVAVAAVAAFVLLSGDDDDPVIAGNETSTAEATAEATPTDEAEATPTEAATATPTQPAPPTATPTFAPPPGVDFSAIRDIRVDGASYVVDFETFEFDPVLPGQHVHFFFDTVTVANAGSPGSGPWELYGGPSPFTAYGPGDRPPGAEQLCVLVANPDHSIQRDTGNCFDLPD